MWSKILKLMLVLVFLPSVAWADTHAAASASRTDVLAAITASASGDTVTVPAGTVTWSSAITISKEIKLIGAGLASTIINCSGQCISIDGVAANGSRVSGFRFNGGSDMIYVWDATGWRIDNNYFYSASAFVRAVMATTTSTGKIPHGLIDNNTMHNATVLAYGTSNMLSAYDYQHELWLQAMSFGDVNAVYVEDNTISASQFGNVIDCNYGGRYVFRYNTVTDYYIEAHSVQGQNRACRRWEIYGNDLSCLVDNREMSIRGGSGYIFNNTLAENSGYIQLNNVRSCRDPGGTDGKCSGSSDWDQNTGGMSGYACRDQIGRSSDSSLWDHSPAGAYAQPLTPAYIFYNKRPNTTEMTVSVDAGEACSPTDLNDTHIVPNRDYYVYSSSTGNPHTTGVRVGTKATMNAITTCTDGVGFWVTDEGTWNTSGSGGQGQLYTCSSNAWGLKYTPYTYPHPLAGGGDTTPPTVTSANVNGSTATINFSETVVTTGYDSGDFNLDCTTPTLTDNLLTSPVGTGASRTFTIATPIAYGQTCNLDYTGSTNDIEDEAGNDLAVFSNTSVTNTTPPPSVQGCTISGGTFK